MNKEKDNQLMVSIRCTAFNQEPYIRQCLEGFVMQKTNFRFEAIVHDDASKDGTADIIREYSKKYPNIIKPIFEIENQYSKHDGSFQRIVDSHLHGKYIAMCEGDDYWTDPYKLQKQVDFLEAHPNHSLCFCAHDNLYPDGKIIHVNRYNSSIEICPMEDVILGGGGYMATASMIYKREILDLYPEWAKNLPVGDLPLMLVCTMHGNIGYINYNMVVYRRNSIGSWSQNMSQSIKKVISSHLPIRNMWKQFDISTKREYHNIIKRKIYLNDKSLAATIFYHIYNNIFKRK